MIITGRSILWRLRIVPALLLLALPAFAQFAPDETPLPLSLPEPPQRHIDPLRRAAIVAYLALSPAKARVIAIAGDAEAMAFGAEFRDVLIEAGWDVSPWVGTLQVYPASMVTVGAKLTTTGTLLRHGELVDVPDDSPLGRLLAILQEVNGVPYVSIHQEPRDLQGVITVTIGTHPDRGVR